MNTKILFSSLVLIVVGTLFGYLLAVNSDTEVATKVAVPKQTTEISKDNCIADECLLNELDYPVLELAPEVEEALKDGLDDEYKAYSTYQAIMDTYGNIRPFIMIARAEQRHIASLQALFDKYGIQIPENPYIDNIQVPGEIQEACQLGVEAEIENIKLYKEKLLPLVADYPDITQVFTNLMNASEQKHLPAFEKCN